MQLFKLIPGLLIGIAVFVFMILFVVVLILGIIALLKKDFTLFKRFGKYLLYDVVFIILVTTIWGLIQVTLKI